MTSSLTLFVPEHLHNQRADIILATLFPEYSRAQHQRWMAESCVHIDGVLLHKPKMHLRAHQCITLTPVLTAREVWEAQDIPLTVLYEDEAVLVINKPAGLTTHPGAGQKDHTLVNALLHYLPTQALLPRAGLVHRLDKLTSGLLIVAKTGPAHTALVAALKRRDIHRTYEAIVYGIPTPRTGTIDAPMGRHTTLRTRMCVTSQGKPAITHYRVTETFRALSHLTVTLETGRTHQIRVHLTHIGHPLLGDPTYTHSRLPLNRLTESVRTLVTQCTRQALHASQLSFLHPLTHEPITVHAPLPSDMIEWQTALREDMTDGCP
ncbi:MAG: hypothetical protein A3J38_04825 [Gammaproteobacteria bacterium RIFCSPHIGHO2_12_FULL_45_9]|nr:MAG: hypothetical protein A3J38_04825 [Gammaproteobacteria bacterium RIFCSPHIGHO2_12_FULL_45_9]